MENENQKKEKGNQKEKKQKSDKAGTVSSWAKATEYVAKALVAVVTLVGAIIWGIKRR